MSGVIIGTGLAILGVSAAPILLGFGIGGVAAGSAAAAIQAGIGNVAAGSLFATATSLGMSGVFAGGAAAGGVITAAGAAIRALF